MRKRFDLSADWEFNIGDDNPSSFKLDSWLAASIPGAIHTDLLNHKLINEPFYNDNEKKLEWICETDWKYRTTFNKPENFANDLPVHLIFEGLDTIAEIFLNGSLLGKSENMFLKYEYDVTEMLKDENLLEVNFKSPIKYTMALENKFGKLRVALNSARVYIRKAQYSFGWDWGPTFPTMGIWRPVYLLQKKKNYIENILFFTKEIQNDKASVSIKVKINQQSSENQKLKISISNSEQNFDRIIEIKSTDTEVDIDINNPKLWWPNGEGEQNLYNLKVQLFDKNDLVDLAEKKVGIRSVSLQLKDRDKNTFRFLINGRAVFAKGVNWIPADSFLPRVSDEKYKNLLMFAKEANMNIVRVWGGGFYENDNFYELCDELGFLVWQDFMFACAAYPEHEEFLNNVREEVKQNIQRLQYHPSIAIWCGNNENEWIWVQERKTSYTEMPGYKIYHDLIPEILKDLDPNRPYWQSSPFGLNEDPNSHSSGNRHEWGIWSRWIDYSEVKNDESLFVTEFGFQGPANKKTFEKYLSEENRTTQNRVFEFHNKQVEGPERIFKFLSGNLPVKTEWEDFIYLSQLNQALALKTCLEHWRINWPVSNGSIIWQLNDCWPVTSWAIVDSELTPKISYFFVKNIFQQEIIGFKKDGDNLNLIALNQLNEEKEFIINLQVFSDKTGEVIFKDKFSTLIPAWSKKEIHKNYLKDLNYDGTVIIVSLVNQEDKLLFRNFYTEQKWKYKTLTNPRIKAEMKNETTVIVESDKPAFFVDLNHPEFQIYERGFIILPGERKELSISGNLRKTDLDEFKIFTLNNYLKDKI